MNESKIPKEVAARMSSKRILSLTLVWLALSPMSHAEIIGGENPSLVKVTISNAPWNLSNVTDGNAKVTAGPHVIEGAGIIVTNNETDKTVITINISNDGCLKLRETDPCNTEKAMKVTAVTLANLGDTYSISNTGTSESKEIDTTQDEENSSASVSLTFAQGSAMLAAGDYSATITVTASSTN